MTTKIEIPELDPAKSNTLKTQQHEACSYCYVVCVAMATQSRQWNTEEVQNEEHNVKTVLANIQPMRINREDLQALKSATT